MTDLKAFMRNNEQVLWEGRPDKKVTVLEGIFNPMMPFALLWGLIDFGVFIGSSMASPGEGLFIIPFLLIHAMPVWIYLGGCVTVALRWRNISYLVTTGGLYVSSGLFSFNYRMKPWTDIGHINVHQGIFDRMFGVGDVVFICAHTHVSSHGNHSDETMKISNISEFMEVFKLVNNLQTDIYSDTMYPNAQRPTYNPGYNTQYNRR